MNIYMYKDNIFNFINEIIYMYLSYLPVCTVTK